MLETQRLLLREMTEADAADRVFPQYAHGLGRWACIEKSSGAFIGWCGIKHYPEDGEYDVGYRFFEGHWGKGYATEAGSAVCEFARQELRGKRVVGKAMLENRASRHVLEKLGMVFERNAEEDGCVVAVYVLAT